MARLTKLADAVTTTGVKGMASAITDGAFDTDTRTFQVTGATTAGAGAATVLLEVSNDNVAWMTFATITLTLSTTASADGTVMSAPWGYVRANIPGGGLTGTGANVTVTMSV